MKQRWLGPAVLAAAVASASLTRAQSSPPPRAPSLKVGLALSGGAARGLAHIGVLKVLEAAGVRVDVVAGTSMGSVVGGLYAVGYTASQLDSIVTSVEWSALWTDPVPRRDLAVDRKSTEDHYLLTLPIYRRGIHLPRSVVAGQRISQLLESLTWSVHGVRDFHRLPIAFSAVATDLERGTAVVLDHGFLPDAIRASMAVPSVFAPVEIENRALIDGGVVRNLPAQDARALGADVLICSDVTDPLEPRDSIISIVDILVQSVSFRIWDSEAEEQSHCDVLIKPDVHGLGFDRTGVIIARGESAARTALPEIEVKLGSASPVRETRPPSLPGGDSVLVTALHFDPADVPVGFLERTLGLQPLTWVTRRELDRAISRLYATGLFESVRYQLEPAQDAAPQRRTLRVILKERSAGRFGVGLRYDSRYKASVLLSSTLGADHGFGWSGQGDVRLGQQIQVGVGASRPLGDGRAVSLRAGADYAHGPFDLYSGAHRIAQARVDLGALSTSIVRSLGTAAQLAAKVKTEHARWDEDVSAVDSAPIGRTFYTAAGALTIDTYDRGILSRRGVGVTALTEWAPTFSHQFADVRAYVPLGRTLSLWAGATIGASGGDPPPHYRFFLGGANSYYLFPDREVSFVGLYTQARHGRHLQKVELGAQWEFVPTVFGRLRWNAGTVLDRWTWDPTQFLQGADVEVAVKTFVGLARVSLSGSAHTAWPIVEIDLGQAF
ncbi:MAG TPA: patatin-like phospholipase family protein [Gemmatimonadales bacterium]|nr:patatin-like phospholipase family protein [Gemmatimonadales bacterium]